MTTKITVYIPSTRLGNQVMDNIKDLTKIAGGSTTTKGIGSWIDKDGNPVTEPVTMVSFLLGPNLNDTVEGSWWDGLLKNLIHLLHDAGEESVLVESQDVNTLFFNKTKGE